MTRTVVHIAAFPPAGAGGVERRLIDYLSQVDDGNVHVLCAIDPSDDMEKTIKSLPVRTFVLRRRFRLDVRLIFQIAKTLNAVSADIVYARGFTGFLWTSLATFATKKYKLIRGEHGSIALQTMIQKPMDRLFTRKFDRVIFNSEAVKSEFATRVGYPVGRSRVVHNGLDPEKFMKKHDVERLRQSLGIDRDAPIIGTVGNFHPWKDQQTLISAIPAVLKSFPNAIFVLVGEGGQLNHCRELAHEFGVDSSALFTGGQENAPAYHALFDVFVLPSIYESFGNVLVEAALAGKPAIATRVGGIPEIVVDGVTGVLLRPTVDLDNSAHDTLLSQRLVDIDTGIVRRPRRLNPEVLAGAIVSLLSDKSNSEALGRAARERAIDKFGQQLYSDHLSQIYSELVAS